MQRVSKIIRRRPKSVLAEYLAVSWAQRYVSAEQQSWAAGPATQQAVYYAGWARANFKFISAGKFVNK